MNKQKLLYLLGLQLGLVKEVLGEEREVLCVGAGSRRTSRESICRTGYRDLGFPAPATSGKQFHLGLSTWAADSYCKAVILKLSTLRAKEARVLFVLSHLCRDQDTFQAWDRPLSGGWITWLITLLQFQCILFHPRSLPVLGLMLIFPPRQDLKTCSWHLQAFFCLCNKNM